MRITESPVQTGATLDGDRWYAEPVETLLDDWSELSQQGLSHTEAAQRLEAVGLNELVIKAGESPLKKFLQQFSDFIVLILIAAALISGLLGEWLDAIAIIVIVILNAVIGFIQEYRAEQAIEALKKLTAPNARVVRDREVRIIPAREVVPGDLILLEQGDIVPADARLLASQSLQIEEAALTGESVPVKKDAHARVPLDAPVADRLTMVYASTQVSYGKGRAIVTATGMQTELGKIAGMVESVAEEKTPLQDRLDRIGKYLVYAALAIVAIVFLVGLARGEDPLHMFLVAVSLAVAAVPEGLAAVVTIALALGVRRMAARNALIRRLPSVETLGSTTVIASDKTGTLTQNAMTVRKIVVNDIIVDVTGEGYEPEGEFLVHGQLLPANLRADVAEVLRIGELANTAALRWNEQTGRWEIVGDPTEGAILVAGAKFGLWREEIISTFREVAELPFDSERKRMSMIVRRPNGRYRLYVKGAPDVILNLCTHYLDHGIAHPLTSERRAAILTINRDLANQALRVLGVAFRSLERVPEEPTPEMMEHDLVYAGLIAMIDPPRLEAIAAVEEARRAGIETVMITGDHLATAVAVGRELRLFDQDDVAITGQELEHLSDAELIARVDDIKAYARVSPEHKLRIVRAWKARNQVVAMTGDGVNDAPALKEANIGIAMGITGTDVAKGAADMILADDNYATIVHAIEEGRSIFDNIRRFVHFLLSCNIGEVITMFVGPLLGWPLPLLPIQILWINLATDSLPALALGVEKAEPGIMQRPPRPSSEDIITPRLLRIMLFQGLIIGAVTLAAFAIEYFLHSGSEERARVLAFSTSIFAQNVHAFNLRSNTLSIFKLGLFSNMALIGAFIAVLLSELAIIYIPFFHPIFQTMPLDLADWGLIAGLGVMPLVIMEIVKFVGLVPPR
ncbi:MAG TPA: calcium-translocating P-type ATPase, SERCA-type [Chloroflexi bacterium]|nr:calcium-translocating P-type ATPase, SERCA-type [Chloroflexota bacterium]